MIYLTLVVEDRLSEAVAEALLRQSGQQYEVRRRFVYTKTEIQQKIDGLNNASQGSPYFVLTDQNGIKDCPPSEIRRLIRGPVNANLIYRFAVMEVESWVMAHRDAFAKFLSIPENKIPHDTDKIPHPKECLIGLARKSRCPSLKQAIVPPRGATSKTGPGYNVQLPAFVRRCWNAQQAAQHSPSLNRTLQRLKQFHCRPHER